jgi:uncharacterized protein YoxC
MEHLQSNQEATALDLLRNEAEKSYLKQLNAKKEETRLQRAKRLAVQVATKARELDEAVASVGDLFESILDSDLLQDQAEKHLTDAGYPDPKEHPLAIPNSLTEENLNKFDAASKIIITAQPSDLRDKAEFLMSLCNRLMFEREILDRQLEESRNARRLAVAEIIKINLKQQKAKSSSMTNFRTQF